MKNWTFLMLLYLYFPATAQIQFNSFQEVLKYADIHAIAIQTATIGEQIAETDKKEAFSYLLPDANASLGFNDNITLQPTLVPAQMFNPGAPEGEFEELIFGTKYSYSYGIQAQWDILNFQKIFALQTAKLSIRESKINTDVNRLNTYNQLASTFYSILLTQESILVYEENLQVSESIFEHTQEKFENGVVSEAELNRAEIKRLQNNRTLNQAKNNLEQFYVQLQSQLNTNQPITINDTAEKFVLDDLSINTTHPEVLLQETAVEKQQSIIKQTKAQRLPSLNLVYQNNKTWATDDFFNFSNANPLPQQSFGVGINMSGLLGFTNKQKVDKSKQQLQVQELQLENTRLVKEREDELLQLQMKQAFGQLAETKQILNLQQENDGHAENKYQGGITSLDQRLDQYDDLLAAQDSYLQSLAAYTLAQYKIYIRQIQF